MSALMIWGLRTKLIVSVSVIILVVLSATTILHLRTFERHYLEAISWRSEALAQNMISDLIISARYITNLHGLLESKSLECMRLYQFNQDKNVTHCAIIDASGRIVAHNDRAFWDTPITSQKLLAQVQRRQVVTILDHKNYHTLIPVFDNQQQYMGTIDIGFSGKAFDDKALDVLQDTLLLFASFLMVSGIFVSLLVANVLNKPVKRLMTVMQAVEHEDFDRELNISTRDELGMLADEFNKMRLRLKESIQHREKLIHEIRTNNTRLQVEITERKQAEQLLAEERNLLRTLIDNMPDFIYVKDRECRYLLGNTQVLRSVGLNRLEELVGRSDPELMPFKEMAVRFYESEQAVLTSGEPLINQEEPARDWKTGEPIWILTTKVPFRDNRGRIIGLVGISRDITDLKRSEATLQQLNQELEDRVEARTAELQQANQALKESLETLQIAQNQLVQTEKMAALGNLVAGIAHEINTPLGIGITATSHLQDKTEELEALYVQSAMKRSDLEKYLQAVGQSLRMISGNLNRAADQVKSFKQVAVAQISSERRHFKLKEYLEDVLASLHPSLRNTSHAISLRCAEELEITSYPGAFSQIITNFVMNSLMHAFDTKQQGEIHIAIEVQELLLYFRYWDNGCGMTEEVCQKIFEPFFTTKRGQGGTGLGLHIVYNLVTQQLGGTIECESTPGAGTRFLLCIPLQEPS